MIDLQCGMDWLKLGSDINTFWLALGSGKSYTMMGSPDNPGIIPRLCNALFDRIKRLTDQDPSVTCKVMFHNDHVTALHAFDRIKSTSLIIINSRIFLLINFFIFLFFYLILFFY